MSDHDTTEELNGKDDVVVKYTMRLPMAPPNEVLSRVIVSR